MRLRLVAMGLVLPDEAVVSFRGLLARLRRRSTTALVAVVIIVFFAMASMTGADAVVTVVLAVAALALGGDRREGTAAAPARGVGAGQPPHGRGFGAAGEDVPGAGGCGG